MISTDIQGITEITAEMRHLEKSKTINLHLRFKVDEGTTFDLALYWDHDTKHNDRDTLKAVINMFDLLGADIRDEAKKIYKIL